MSAQAALGAAHDRVVEEEDGLGNPSYGQDGLGNPSYVDGGLGNPSHEEIDTDVEQAEEPTELAVEEQGQQQTSQQEGAENALTPALSQREREQDALTAALSQREREAVVGRIRSSRSLPPALRDRLVTLIETSGGAAADGQPHVPLDAIVRAVEESLPEFLRGGARDADRIDHRAGDAFFEGGELSDEAAAEIARGQLARSGLLRGQRVRVAED